MKAPWHEQILLHRLYEGRQADAFGELYDVYVEPIYRFIAFKVRTNDEAEDLTAEVFLKTWEYIQRRERRIDNFRAFIYRLARNIVVDHYRQSARKELAIGDEELSAIPESMDKHIATLVERGSDVALAESKLRLLKDEYREALILRYIEDYPIADIAKIMEKSRGAVRVILHRALIALRQEMEHPDTPKSTN